MSPWLSWACAWGLPAVAALWTLAAVSGLLIARWRAADRQRPDGRTLALGVGLAGIAALVRLLFVPALLGHRFDGHEAEYLDIFLGQRPLEAGSTALYPAMQALWFALGHLLPRSGASAILFSVALGVGAAGLLASALSRLATPRVGWVAGALLALHPAQAAWSGSAYNVIAPHLLLCLSLWAVATLVGEEAPPGRRALAWLAGGALALAMSCRLETAVGLAPLAALALCRPGLARRLWPPLVLGALVGVGATSPLLAGGVPGEGEQLLAFTMNVLWPAPLGRLGSAPGLVLLAVGATLAWIRWPRPSLALFAGSLLAHLALASFDDLGERHLLVLLPAITWALAAGGLSFGWRSAAVPGLAVLLLAGELVDLRGRYEGSESSFAAMLDRPPYQALPRFFVHHVPAPGRSPVDPSCGFVSEDPRIAAPPLSSHFNLWSPEEAERLRGPEGCLHWCLDAADWRWSSRAVRDRALRVSHLFALEPVAVVEEPSSGYACLVMEVGPRRCCGPELPLFAPRLRAVIP